MNDLMAPFFYALAGAEIMLILLGLASAVLVPAVDKWNKHFFISFFSFLLLYAFFCVTEDFVQNDPWAKKIKEILYYCETLLYLILLLKITFFLHHSCGEDWRKSTFFRVVAVLLSVIFILLNIAPFSDLLYVLTESNQFLRGPLYVPAIIAVTSVQIVNMLYLFCHRKKVSRRYFYVFSVGLAPQIVFSIVHCFVSVFTLLGFGMAVCTLSILGIILFDQIDQTIRQQREIANQRASIMVLQMRPHFIYNTMMSIYYLCKQDPELAQQVTMDFTTYLRRNFTAIASEDLIPFSRELEHTRAYLAVEQAQFSTRLFVEYDTPCVDFCLPPLTLQPIVENAVKHGMDPDSDPLHILIRTAGSGSSREIIVEDTGTGFDPDDSGEPHIAMDNIRHRLAMMCSGKLTVSPREGGGTVVRVTIPHAVVSALSHT